MKELIITKELSGGRLDKMIAKYLDKAPKSFVYKMLRKKNIVLNGKKAQGNEILAEGDAIRFYLADATVENFRSSGVREAQSPESSERAGGTGRKQDGLRSEGLIREGQGGAGRNESARSATASAGNNQFHKIENLVVYEDDNLIAFCKPAGMLSQKAERNDYSLNEYLLDYLKQKQQTEAVQSSQLFTPGVSNRLDRNTTGLVLAGKTLAASRELNNAIRERRLDKFYYCLVKGRISEKQTIDGYLVKDEAANTVHVYTHMEETGDGARFVPGDKAGTAANALAGDQSDKRDVVSTRKKAARIITAYEPAAGNENVTLLQVDLITGKSHQIRAHLASIGHPIIGDGKYGNRRTNAAYQKMYGLKRQLLHAWKIRFHSMGGVLAYLNGTEITAPLPEDFSEILQSELN